MANYDLRIDVPARAYINAQLLSLLDKGGTLFDAKTHLFPTEPYLNSGINAHNYSPFYDQSLAAALLFCTIVVPREILVLPANHKIFRDFDAEKVTGLFTITNPASIDSYMFINALRNSVAHALFSVSDSGSELQYQFWTDRNPFLKATIGHHGLIKFVSIVGKRLTDSVLGQK